MYACVLNDIKPKYITVLIDIRPKYKLSSIAQEKPDYLLRKMKTQVIIHRHDSLPYMPTYRKVSNISRTLVGNLIVVHSDVLGASPVGAAPTTSSFST